MAINENVIRRNRERKIFLIVAILFPFIVLIGFARTYYLKEFFGAPPLATMLVHLHGAVMTTWVALFVTQIWLIRSKNIRLHQTLGLAGVGLAVLIVAVGLTVSINQAARGVTPVPEVPPSAFLAIPVFDLLVFVILFAGAVYYRKRPTEHKRLMLLTAINFLPPAVARIPIQSLTALGPLWFFGFPDVIALICLGYDTWRNGRLNKVFLAGTLVMIASGPLRIILSGTDIWARFATWLTT